MTIPFERGGKTFADPNTAPYIQPLLPWKGEALLRRRASARPSTRSPHPLRPSKPSTPSAPSAPSEPSAPSATSAPSKPPAPSAAESIYRKTLHPPSLSTGPSYPHPCGAPSHHHSSVLLEINRVHTALASILRKKSVREMTKALCALWSIRVHLSHASPSTGSSENR